MLGLNTQKRRCPEEDLWVGLASFHLGAIDDIRKLVEQVLTLEIRINGLPGGRTRQRKRNVTLMQVTQKSKEAGAFANAAPLRLANGSLLLT